MKQAFFIILILTISVLIYKTVHYLQHFSGKRFFCWLYFGRSEIMLSSTTSRRIAKERQNMLSIIAIVGFVVSACIYVLLY